MGEVANDRLATLIRWQEFVLTAGGREEFLQRVAVEGFDEACESQGLPRGRVLAFLAEHADLSEAAKRALEMQTHVLVGETIDIADSDGFLVQRDRLRVETRLKVAGMWNRRAYGQRVDVAHTGEVVVSAEVTGLAVEMLALVAARRGLAPPVELEVLGETLPADVAPAIHRDAL